MINIRRYVTPKGRIPFDEWLDGLKSPAVHGQILTRLFQVAAGNFGDAASVGQGVMELRIHKGPGYRVYYGLDDKTLLVLLIGGDKSSQFADIRKAKRYWMDWKRRGI